MELRLRQMRKALGLTQTEFAKKVGVTQRVVSSWETGETALTVEDACACASALGCTLDELAGRTPEYGIDSALANNYRAMSPEGRAALLAASMGLAARFGNECPPPRRFRLISRLAA